MVTKKKGRKPGQYVVRTEAPVPVTIAPGSNTRSLEERTKELATEMASVFARKAELEGKLSEKQIRRNVLLTEADSLLVEIRDLQGQINSHLRDRKDIYDKTFGRVVINHHTKKEIRKAVAEASADATDLREFLKTNPLAIEHKVKYGSLANWRREFLSKVEEQSPEEKKQ